MRINALIRKVKNKIAMLTALVITFAYTNPALADVTEVDAASFNAKVLGVLEKYLTPLGGTIILIAIVVGGVKMLLNAYSPDKRKETMSGLGYVLLGAAFVGGAMFFAGVLLGLGKSFNG
ncbi:MAG: TrbC/VirB2 family protein [Syntrophomonadaceae bacterium]